MAQIIPEQSSGLTGIWVVAYFSLWGVLTLMLEIPEAHEVTAWLAVLIALSATLGLNEDLRENLAVLFQ